MKIKERIRTGAARGRFRLFRVPSEGAPPRLWTPLTRVTKNAVLYDWATIVGKLLTAGSSDYRLNGIYLEFQNTGSPPATVPSFGRADGISYYDSLADSLDTDYLRLPLIASTLTSGDETLFPSGNVVTAYAQTLASQVTGVHGKAFTDAADSVITGAALVAIVDPADRTKDLVFSRAYLAESDQLARPGTGQVAVAWELELL